mmetsp:Transcript_60003/g.127069  ORF Transcript_60003/g.127069 Transcript_60003/m.127069 type:complete len:81 (+) Transcript_60003:22-264(+)
MRIRNAEVSRGKGCTRSRRPSQRRPLGLQTAGGLRSASIFESDDDDDDDDGDDGWSTEKVSGGKAGLARARARVTILKLM